MEAGAFLNHDKNRPPRRSARKPISELVDEEGYRA